jgi:isopenicillin-N epimerase
MRVIDAVADAIGPETRLAVFDHITSESALIFPVVELVALCHSRGVPVLVDGAHAPGALALDVSSLGADWYTANLHKWAHAPRSSGFLWVHPDRQRDVHPPVICPNANGEIEEVRVGGTCVVVGAAYFNVP